MSPNSKQRREQRSGFTFKTDKIAKTMHIRKRTAYYVLGRTDLGLFSRRRNAKYHGIPVKTWSYRDVSGNHYQADELGRKKCLKSLISRTNKIKKLRKLQQEIYWQNIRSGVFG